MCRQIRWQATQEYISSWSLNLIVWPLGGSRSKLWILTSNQLLSCYGEQANTSRYGSTFSYVLSGHLMNVVERWTEHNVCLQQPPGREKEKKKNPVSRSSHTVSFCGAFFFSVGAVCLGWCESCQSNPGVDQTTRQGQKRSHQTFSVFVRNIQTNELTTGCLMMNFEN